MDETFLNGPNDLVMEMSRISPNDEEEKKKLLSSTIKNDFSEDSQKESRKIVKNVVLISIAFLINFTSSIGLSVLQSSLHMHQGMGVINGAVLYAALVISCLFIPPLMINKMGYKWTIAVSFIGYIFFGWEQMGLVLGGQ